MLRVGISAAVLKPQRFGVDTVLEGVVSGLSLVAERETILLFGSTSTSMPNVESRLFEYRSWPALSRLRLLRVPWEQVALPVEARRTKLDVIHSPAYTAPLLSRVPIVLTVHDMMTIIEPAYCRALNRVHHALLFERSVHHATRIVTLSDAVSHQVRDRFGVPAEKIRVIPPGIDQGLLGSLSDHAKNLVRDRFALPERFMLWVGNLEPKKNIPNLLASVEEATRRGLRMPLVMAGGSGWGPVKPAALASENVRWLGYVAKHELAALYKLANLFVFPSLSEGFGMPVLEAMASGIPVVASAVPAVAEFAKTAVCIVDPLDVQGMAGALLRVAEDTEYRAQLVGAGHAAIRDMSWERHARQLISVYWEAHRDG